MIPPSELPINEDGSVFHLHLRPEQIADRVILVGDQGRVDMVASYFDTVECEVQSREFHTITGIYKGKRISCVSTGIGCDNIDIVMISNPDTPYNHHLCDSVEHYPDLATALIEHGIITK